MKFFGVRPWSNDDIEAMRAKAAAEGAETVRQQEEFFKLVADKKATDTESDDDSRPGQPS